MAVSISYSSLGGNSVILHFKFKVKFVGFYFLEHLCQLFS